MQGRAEGFTIIEVTLFLAISGLLLLIMFVGTGMAASRQRFTDTTDSLQVFFQAQYDEVVHGVNIRDDTVKCSADASNNNPGQSKCLLLGKLLTINPSGTTITASYVISTSSIQGDEGGDFDKLKAAGLQVLTSNQTTYELKWGAKVSEATRSTSLPSGSGRGDVNSVAFLRVPDSNHIAQLYYNDSGGGIAAVFANDDTGAYNPSGTDANPSLVACVANDDDFVGAKPRSAIFFGQGQGAGTMTTNYEPESSLCAL